METILKTCKNTETPPNPSKNAHTIILIDIFLIETEEIILTPLVSSIIPVIIPDINEVGICNKLNIDCLGIELEEKWYNIAKNRIEVN